MKTENKMSYDMGTYVLRTSTKDEESEYRVVCTGEIDSIYGNYVSSMSSFLPNAENILKIFGPAKVFLDMEEALEYADIVESDMKSTEHGICVISEFKNLVFEDLKNRDTEDNGTG